MAINKRSQSTLQVCDERRVYSSFCEEYCWGNNRWADISGYSIHRLRSHEYSWSSRYNP